LGCSADGQRILVAPTARPLQRSVDGGATWSPVPSLGSRAWLGAASSADGQRLAVVTQSKLFTSDDGGSTWATELASADAWKTIAMTPDGSVMLAGASDLWTRKSSV
jgi:photosystem II stability/assembly factor-like uncharacterized protein